VKKHEFDQFSDTYDSVLKKSIPAGLCDETYFAQYKVDLIASKLDGLKPINLLDFGCGCGRSMSHLALRFPSAEIFGFDPSAESLAVAAKKAPFAQLSSDWGCVPAKKFDLIFAANVFHHIPPLEQVRVLMECRSALSQNGLLFVFEQNPFNPLVRYVFERCPFDVGAEMISMSRLKKLCTSAGLRTIQHGYTLFFPKSLEILRPAELHWVRSIT
jgi:trans-aconitate methyltransferase